ncbi:PDZ domain-containing protein [Viscerimonas tarda]
MKRLFSVILFIVTIFSITAQTTEQTCHFGITFEISNNANWGYGEPVILTVEPNSAADIAGIKPGDIIMEINGAATYLRNYQTIAPWLFDSDASVATFTIRNLKSYFKEYELPRQCRPVNSISESELATSFSFYSLENTQERVFILPLQITTSRDVDYSDYRTYSFIDRQDNIPVDRRITAELEKVLNEKGLVFSADNADILIQTYYTYLPNPKYNPLANTSKETSAWRYNPLTKEMVSLPILSGDNPLAEHSGQFILEFGIRFFDKKYINPNAATLIWEAHVKEYTTSQFTLEEYIPIHAPLIFMHYPYSSSKLTAKYVVSKKKYYYTGLYYSTGDMKTITDVERNSPAYRAGIRPGAVIEKINDTKFVYNKTGLLNGYKRFISETMKYRNPQTLFVDAQGFPDCMYWKESEYKNVKNAFGQTIYTPIFKYLYNFEKYISGKPVTTLSIETKGKKYKITPEERSSISVRTF